VQSDVIVAGAGPAGALAATILARAGARVQLFDRARFPRHKLCGDTLNPGALRVLAAHMSVAPIVERALPLDGMLLTGQDVAVRGTYGRGVYGHAIVRRELDDLLLHEALQAGVQFDDQTTVVGPSVAPASRDISGVVIRRADGRTIEARADMVIAADGRASRLARAAGLASRPARPRRWAIGGYFAGAHVEPTCGEMHVRAGHYIGVSPVPGGLTNACLVVPHARGGAGWRDPATLLCGTIRHDRELAERFADAILVEPPQVLGPMAVDARAAGTPGMVLAGDAAGFIDPITGDGLRLAFEGAVLAADVVADVLGGRCTRHEAPAMLAERRRAAFARKWRFNRAIRGLVAAPAAVAAATVVARIMPRAFEAVIRYAGDCE
jgi:flavin-dependent dehydrogenase